MWLLPCGMAPNVYSAVACHAVLAPTRDSSLDVSANHVAAFAKFLVKELAASAKAKMAATARPHIIARTWEE